MSCVSDCRLLCIKKDSDHGGDRGPETRPTTVLGSVWDQGPSKKMKGHLLLRPSRKITELDSTTPESHLFGFHNKSLNKSFYFAHYFIQYRPTRIYSVGPTYFLHEDLP